MNEPNPELIAAVERALKSYRCYFSLTEEGDSMPLVDQLSPQKDFTIEHGQQEMELLTDFILSELQPVVDGLRHQSDSLRDGNWMDKMGACKVCNGEIPHGHANGCDIYKLEQEVSKEKHRAEQAEQKVRVLREALEEISTHLNPIMAALLVVKRLDEGTDSESYWEHEIQAHDSNTALISKALSSTQPKEGEQ